ncbi:MAG: patatin-like phospholipase family protein [Microvirga sp.]
MTKQGQKPIEVGLVLQGGGALGAYEWGAVTALLELMDEAETAGREVALKGVTGVSIGAINAACIVGSHGRADARRRLKELWEDLRLDAPSFLPAQVQRDLAFFGLPGFYAPRMDVWALPGWKYLYDTSPLIETLRRHVDFKALNASPTTFVVTAVDVVSGVLTRFRNHPHPREGKDRPPPKREADHVCEIEPRHILASGSLAPQFPWVEIGGASYWDGGLVDNTPLGDAIDAFSDAPDADRRLVVMNLYPLRARLPQNLAEVQDRVHELSFGNRLRQDHDSANRVNDLIGTICELAALVPEGKISGELKARVERANRFKRIEILDLDMQDPEHSPLPGRQEAEQDPADDQDGLRDFSPATVERRRAHGYEFARRQLGPWFGAGEAPLAAGGNAAKRTGSARRVRVTSEP